MKNEKVSKEASANNFVAYEEEVGKVIAKYNLNMYRESSSFTDGYFTIANAAESLYSNIYYFYLIEEHRIIAKNNSIITIYLKNSSTREEVTVSYNNRIVSKDEATKEFDLALFVELVNAVSGKQITEDMCKEFLSAPEEKYRSSNGKLDSQDIFKIKFLNFGEDWYIDYTLYNDMVEDLSFSGLTKAGTK